MARPVILCTQAMHEAGRDLLTPVADLLVPADASAAALDALLPGADYLVVRNHLRPGFLDQPHKLRGIVRHGTGLDMIPMAAATLQRIPVANVPGANAQAVAEYVVGCFFTLARRLCRVDATLRSGTWQQARAAGDGAVELAGRTVGIVGMGHIGRRVAATCANGLGMRVVAHHPRPSSVPEGIECLPLDELLRTSDFVTLNCPLTDETRGLVDARRIALMKPGAFLVNAARGEIVDEAALASALAARAIGGAAVDVFSTQPLPAGHPFRRLDNMLLTAHIAGLTAESARDMSVGTARQLLQLLRGERPDHLVNAQIWEAQPW